MASINGLPPSLGPVSSSSRAISKKDKTAKADTAVSKPNKVARAVSSSIHHVDNAEFEKSRLQYDLPEGRGRQAMEQYWNVLNQAKREELAQMLGVDIYI